MKVLSRLLVPLLVLLPGASFAWAYGGINARIFAKVLPFALLPALLALFVLPERREGETRTAARKRVRKAIFHDAFFGTSLALVLYLAFALFNVGLCPRCDALAIEQGASAAAPLKYLPFCVRSGEHAGVLRWFVGALISALAVRHALTREGKRIFLELVVFNGALLALFGFAQPLTAAEFPFWGKVERPLWFFSTFAYPNMAGAFFAAHYALALGLWFHRLGQVEDRSLGDEKRGSLRHPFLFAHYPVVAVFLCFFAVLASLSRAAMALTILLTVIFVAYMVGRLTAVFGHLRARRLKSLVMMVIFMLAAWGSVTIYAPPKVLKELKTINLFTVAERVSGRSEVHSRAVSAVMRAYPLFGTGGWGYRHFSTLFVSEKEARQLRGAGGANVHNDYLQFIAEHGLVGFALIVAAAWILCAQVISAWRKLVLSSIAKARSGMGVSSLAVFAVSPIVFWTFLGWLALLIHAFGDCPFRSPAILTLFFTMIAAAAGCMPRREKLDR